MEVEKCRCMYIFLSKCFTAEEKALIQCCAHERIHAHD